MPTDEIFRSVRTYAQTILSASDNATSGPWIVTDTGDVGHPDGASVATTNGVSANQSVADACFIAQTRNIAPSLAREVLKLLAEVPLSAFDPPVYEHVLAASPKSTFRADIQKSREVLADKLVKECCNYSSTGDMRLLTTISVLTESLRALQTFAEPEDP